MRHKPLKSFVLGNCAERATHYLEREEARTSYLTQTYLQKSDAPHANIKAFLANTEALHANIQAEAEELRTVIEQLRTYTTAGGGRTAR